MAAGDITYDAGPKRSGGDHHIMTGQIEADGTARTFALADTKSYLLYCNLTCTTDDATNDIRCVLNVTSDFSTAANGSIGVQAEAADTFNFVAGYI